VRFPVIMRKTCPGTRPPAASESVLPSPLEPARRQGKNRIGFLTALLTPPAPPAPEALASGCRSGLATCRIPMKGFMHSGYGPIMQSPFPKLRGAPTLGASARSIAPEIVTAVHALSPHATSGSAYESKTRK